MRAIKIKPSKLDVFKDYYDNLITTEQCIEKLLETPTQSDKMRFGIDFERAIFGKEFHNDSISPEWVLFARDLIQRQTGLPYHRFITDIVFHTSADIHGERFYFSGILDYGIGLFGGEIKTTALDYWSRQTLDGEDHVTNALQRFSSSLQGKLYLLYSGIELLHYNIFIFDKERTNLKDYKTFAMFRSEVNVREIEEILTEFSKFITKNNLEQHFIIEKG